MSLRLSAGFPFACSGAHVGRGAENHADACVIAGEVIVGELPAHGADVDSANSPANRLRQPEVQHLDRAVRRGP